MYDFPSFSEGLSLRGEDSGELNGKKHYFPSFSEGLSLRGEYGAQPSESSAFPFLFGGTFIEGSPLKPSDSPCTISLPFRRDFH